LNAPKVATKEEQQLALPEKVTTGNSTDTLSLPLKTNPAELLVVQKAATQEPVFVAQRNDSISLPLKTNPAELLVVQKVATQEPVFIAQRNDSSSMPLKANPAELLVVQKVASHEPVFVAQHTDSISLPVETNSESISGEKALIVQDSVKLNLPVKLHRIDQPVPVSKIPKNFTLGDTLYKVQLLALPKPLKDKNYFAKLMAAVPGLTVEETLGEDGLYHYSTKTFKGIAEAAKYQRMIRKSGWKDSFVAKYAGERRTEATFRTKLEKSGKEIFKVVPVEQIPAAQQQEEDRENKKEIPKEVIRVEPDKAQQTAKPYSALHYGEITSEERETLSGEPGDTLYQVQLLALRNPIHINTYFALLLSKMPGLKIEESHGDDGLYRYNTKPFANRQKARDFEQAIRNNGWIDCFIATNISGRSH
jgi:hypothetical protein